jgi:hypothetical protein
MADRADVCIDKVNFVDSGSTSSVIFAIMTISLVGVFANRAELATDLVHCCLLSPADLAENWHLRFAHCSLASTLHHFSRSPLSSTPPVSPIEHLGRSNSSSLLWATQ